jgi:integral membrane protein (TIGR00529 family)
VLELPGFINSTIFSVPYSLRILLAFSFILFLYNIRKNLLWAMTGGTVLLAAWSGHSFLSALQISKNRFISENNISLLLIIFLILAFSSQMKESGMMERLVDSVKRITTRKISISLLPALIGLLPMPGGAIFSAPLVDSSDTEKKIIPVKKTAINYWFRHIWEFWWPLYPGVLLAVEISGVSLFTFITLMLPLTLVSVLAGTVLLLWGISNERDQNFNVVGFTDLFYSLFPLAIVIVATVISGIVLRLYLPINDYVPIAFGTLCGMAFLQIRNPVKRDTWLTLLKSPKTYELLLLIAVIRIFGAFIESPLPEGPMLMDAVRLEFVENSIPVLATIIALPFISGLTTGVSIGFVGASFPIILTLTGVNPEPAVLYSAVVLGYTAGYAGMILSPVHVCLIVSNSYFQSELTHSLRYILAPALIVLLFSLLLYFIYFNVL